MKNSQRQIVKIFKELCQEYKIPLKLYTYDWVMELNIQGKYIYVYGYQFSNNNASAQLICNDKAALSELLISHGIDAVEHIFFMPPNHRHYIGDYNDSKRMIDLLKQHKKLVCKLNNGTSGDDVYMISNTKELKKATDTIFNKNNSLSISPFYEIENEYRLVILNNKVELVYRKEIPLIKLANGKTQKANWKHNLGLGAKAIIETNSNVIEKLSDIALSSTKLININFASVDIIKVKNKYKVLEINSGIMMENFAIASEQYYQIAKNIYRKCLLGHLK